MAMARPKPKTQEEQFAQTERDMIEKEERKRLYLNRNYEVLKADAEVALKLQQDLLDQFYYEDLRMSYIQERREEIRSKLHERRFQRQQLEQSLLLDMPAGTNRHHLNSLKDREHLTKSLNTFSESMMNAEALKTTKRNTLNPEYDQAFCEYLYNNKDVLLSRHLHRDRDRQFRTLQQTKRTIMEEDIGTPFIKQKKKQDQERKKQEEYQDKKKTGVIADNKEVFEVMSEISRFETGYNSD
ncbi:predicted protein [Naegleria gruberi]|uniref:Predicted protein n=1 Tax=Naegleria gruberi TaxID=5762 RepID=D2W3Z9_NAEGR|nr:uncharacterized protein NAEGRDRAFT_76126 [Naegleria gruberi]EFC36206.1 predicted protein [Naegleria gruberi]|eukprot:XP_002668950.1 predicted protein [Naegleria gruberi strain NEG-M]